MNQQSLSNRILLVLLTILLALPQAAWGQSYGLIVGGTEVTSENAANIFDDAYASAKYDASTHTLTLQGCHYSADTDNRIDFISIGNTYNGTLNVHLIGYNEINASYYDENNPNHFISSSSERTVNITTDATIPGKLEFNTQNGTMTNQVELYFGSSGLSLTENTIKASSTNNISYFGITLFDETGYTGDDNFPRTDSNWNYSNASVINNSNNYLPPMVGSATSNGTYISRMKKTSGGSDIITSLTFQCKPVSGGTINVVLKNSDNSPVSNQSAFSNGLVTLTPTAQVTYDDVYIEFSSTNSFSFVPLAVKTEYGAAPTYSYDIQVNGAQVTSNEAGPVTMLDGSVVFTPSETGTPTLTLTGANLSEGGIISNLGNLIIEIKGVNTINGYYIESQNGGVLTFKKESTATGTSTLNISNTNDIAAVRGFSSVSFTDTYLKSDYSPISYGVYGNETIGYRRCHNGDGVATSLTITTAPYYQIWIGLVQVNDENKGNFYSENNTLDGKVSFSDNVLSLNAASMTESIVSNLPSLAISISGECAIAVPDTATVIRSVNPNATLTIQKNSNSQAAINTLTLSNTNEAIDAGGVIKGFSAVTPITPIHITTPTTAPTSWTADIKSAVFTDSKAITDESITVTVAEATYTGSALEPAVTVMEGSTELTLGTHYTVAYSNNTNAATANDNDPENAPTVTITGAGNYTGSRTKSFTINKKEITAEMVTLSGFTNDSDNSFTFNGQTQKPTVTVGEANAVAALTLDTDYSLSNNGGTAKGTYGVTVNGMGNYTGDVTKEYTIHPLSLASDNITVSDITDQTFTGTEIVPEVTVMLGNDVLGNTEYTVEGANNTNVNGTGDAVPTLTLTAVNSDTNNFTGSRTVNFNIIQADLESTTIEGITESIPYDGNDHKPTSLTVKLGENIINAETDYTVSYKKGDATVTEVKDTGEYTVVITSKNKNFSTTHTKEATFEITAGEGTISFEQETINKTFGDEPFLIEVTNTGDGVVTYSSGNTNVATFNETNGNFEIVGVGQATITATVTNGTNYTYEINTATYILNVSAKVADFTVTLDDPDAVITYDGTQQMPAITVKDGDTVLSAETDYDLTWGENINVSTGGSVTATGKGNYAGSTGSLTFNIAPSSLEGATLSGLVPDQDLTYTGSQIKPSVVIAFPDNHPAITSNDYTLEYGTNTDAGNGTGTVTATGKGNFTGTKTITFNIQQADFENVTIEDIAAVTYNGDDQSPTSFTVKLGNNIISDNEYAATFKIDNEPVEVLKDAGTYTVVLTSTNNNFNTANTKTTTFTINRADLSSVTIADIPAIAYDGESHELVEAEVLTVKIGDNEVSPKEYVVSYKKGNTPVNSDDIVDPGTYTVVLTATGWNFTEGTTKEKNFVITDPVLDTDDIFPDGQSFASFYSAEQDFLVPNGVKAYIITGIGENTVTVTEASYIKAGVPVLLEKVPGATTVKNAAQSFNSNMLRYTTEIKQTTGAEYVLFRGEFLKATGTIPAYKCYLYIGAANARPRLSIRHEGEGTTGIVEMEATETGDTWYDLNGQKLIKQPTRKGIYIKNGKKIAIK